MADMSQLTPARRALLEKLRSGTETNDVARAIRRQIRLPAQNEHSTMVLLNPEGTQHPFFFLHGAYPSLPLWCLQVAQDIGPDQPVYALEPGRSDWRVAPKFEDWVAEHLEQIRAVQPEGPYLLGGWCGGALVAFEMARQLQANGQTVDLLIMIEPPVLAPHVLWSRHLIDVIATRAGISPGRQLDWFIWLGQLFDHLGRSAWYGYRIGRFGYRMLRNPHIRDGNVVMRLAHRELRKGTQVVQQAIREVTVRFGIGRTDGKREAWQLHAVIPHGSATHARPRDDYLEVYTWMAAAYERTLQGYSGRITLLRVREAATERRNLTRIWTSLAPVVEVQLLAGTRSSCQAEQVHDLAAHIKQSLRQVQLVVEARDADLGVST